MTEEISKLSEKRDLSYKIFLTLIVLLVTSLFYNPFIGENEELWLKVVRFILGIAIILVLAHIVNVVSEIESKTKSHRGMSIFLVGLTLFFVVLFLNFIPVINGNENYVTCFFIIIIFWGVFALFDGLFLIGRNLINTLKGKKDILEFLLKIAPLIASGVAALFKLL